MPTASAPSELALLLARLAEQDAKFAAFEARLERLERRQPKAARQDGAFLAGIARALGARVFSVNELIALAVVNPDFEAHLKGHGLLHAGRLGCRLRTLNGRTIDGFRVASLGRDVFGQQWAIEVE